MSQHGSLWAKAFLLRLPWKITQPQHYKVIYEGYYGISEGVLINLSATLDENLSPQVPLFSDAEILWAYTAASSVTDAMIEASQGS